jgi:hypothetical protein
LPIPFSFLFLLYSIIGHQQCNLISAERSGIIKAMDRPFSVLVVTTGAIISIFSPFSFSPDIYLNNGPKASFSSCAAAVA